MKKSSELKPTTKLETKKTSTVNTTSRNLYDLPYASHSEHQGDGHTGNTGNKEQRNLFLDFPPASARERNDVQRNLGVVEPLFWGRVFLDSSSSSVQLQELLAARENVLENHKTFVAVNDRFAKIAHTVEKLANQIGEKPTAPMANREITSDWINSPEMREIGLEGMLRKLRQTRESLLVASPEMRKTELKGILGELRQTRESILNEVNTLTSINHPIEDYHEIRSDIMKMPFSTLNINYLQNIDAYYDTWQKIKPNQGKLLEHALSQIENIDANIEKTQEALHKATKDSYQLEDSEMSPNELSRLLTDMYQKLIKNKDTLTDVLTRYNKITKSRDVLLDLIKEKSATPATDENSDLAEWISSATKRKTDLENIPAKMLEFKKTTINDINTLFSMSSPVENYHELRSEVQKMHESYRVTFNTNYGICQKYKIEKKNLIKLLIERLGKMDARIDTAKEALHRATEYLRQLEDFQRA